MQEAVAKGQPEFCRPVQSQHPYPRQGAHPDKDLTIQGLLSPTDVKRHEDDDGDD